MNEPLADAVTAPRVGPLDVLPHRMITSSLDPNPTPLTVIEVPGGPVVGSIVMPSDGGAVTSNATLASKPDVRPFAITSCSPVVAFVGIAMPMVKPPSGFAPTDESGVPLVESQKISTCSEPKNRTPVMFAIDAAAPVVGDEVISGAAWIMIDRDGFALLTVPRPTIRCLPSVACGTVMVVANDPAASALTVLRSVPVDPVESQNISTLSPTP